MKVKVSDLYDLNETLAKELLESVTYPWEALSKIGEYIEKIGNSLPEKEYNRLGDNIWISKTATVAPTASLCGPLIIGPGTEVRPGAFIRGNVLVGADCVVGNSTELKNVILFNHVQVPHYNYVGDSVLGAYAHMGAGSVTSNVKADKTEVVIKGEEMIPTGRKKVGAMLGDHVEVGCNSVLNPGTVVGRNSNIYPLSMVRGVVPENHIYKSKEEIIIKDEKH